MTTDLELRVRSLEKLLNPHQADLVNYPDLCAQYTVSSLDDLRTQLLASQYGYELHGQIVSVRQPLKEINVLTQEIIRLQGELAQLKEQQLQQQKKLDEMRKIFITVAHQLLMN